MKKKILIAAAALLLAAAAVFGSITLYHLKKTRTITDFYDNNPNTITKMTITCSNPYGVVEVPKQYYRQVTDMLATLEFTLEFPGMYTGSRQVGWLYDLTIEDNKNGLDICGNKCSIHGVKEDYNLKGDPYKLLEELYQQLYPEHKIPD